MVNDKTVSITEYCEFRLHLYLLWVRFVLHKVWATWVFIDLDSWVFGGKYH